MQIYPSSPWENGYNQLFNGTLRKAVLNAEWFHSTRQAKVAVTVRLRQYNRIRPYHALNMKPPNPETLLEKTKISGAMKWDLTIACLKNRLNSITCNFILASAIRFNGLSRPKGVTV